MGPVNNSAIPLPDALARLAFQPAQVTQVSARQRNALLRFLLRWEQYAQALACLDALIALNPEMVTLLDERAQALQGLGRYDAALEMIQQRQAISNSLSSRMLEGRIYLSSGNVTRALEVAQGLVRESGGQTESYLGFLAQVHLARNEVDRALAIYRQINDLSPDTRVYWLGMLHLHQVQGDLVTASAYAVRLEQSLSTDASPSVLLLRQLHDYYDASGEVNRATDLETTLARLYETELAALGQALGTDLEVVARRGRALQAEARQDETLEAQPIQQIVVSEEERRRLEQITHELFGHGHLLSGQAETLSASLQGQDVLTILRTGGGKSLCYQLPAFLAKGGTTLVISPLIALMKDQVESLPPALRRQSATINSSLEGDELRHVLQQLGAGQLRLVYAAPERLRQAPFLHALRHAGVNRLVIDEAHCVSLWGHDFRPDYLYIGRARHALGDPPVLAMTATAPPRVRRDILQRLDIPQAAIVTGEVFRPNLYLGALRAKKQDDKLRLLLALCQQETGSGIIYVNSRARAEELAQLLDQQGIVAGYYHAGIGDRVQRSAAQDTFMNGDVRVMVATVAFGMGIDKADIRFIIHYDLPASLESYYQEAGRAGRDGQPSRCLLLYTPQDRSTLTGRAKRDQLSIEMLRSIYGTVKRYLGPNRLGQVSLGDLARDAEMDESRARVALSLLEEAGLLRRHQDMPRTAMLEWRASADERAPSDPALAAFVRANHLLSGQTLGLELLQSAKNAGLDALGIEEQVLSWVDAGWMRYRSAGHDLLLEILPAPQEATTQVQELLDRTISIQVQRVAEIMAYAQTTRCRHGYISAYLSGQASNHCQACDNCQPEAARAPNMPSLPSEQEQIRTILQCLAETSWGRMNLIRILRGDKGAPERGLKSIAWSKLAFRSEGALGELIERLLAARLLSLRPLEHGGAALELAPAGRAALHDAAKLDALAAPPAPTRAREKAKNLAEEEGALDEALLERLRIWRREEAQQAKLPPYIIAHDSLLRAIATVQPRNKAQLAAVKGIGPKKLAQYGAALIEILTQKAP